MNLINRRHFLAFGGGAAASALLPLAGCGGGATSAYAPLSDRLDAPMAAAADGPQFGTIGHDHALVIVQRDGTRRTVGGPGRGHGKLNFPVGVAVLNGVAYVVEMGNHRVQVFDGAGNALRTLGEGTLDLPGGIAAGAAEIFVADSRHGRVVAFTPSGEVTRILGSGLLSAPLGIEVVADGVLVADPGLRQVVKLGFDNRISAVYGANWVLPYDVATDGRFLYVVDASRKELGVTSLEGELLPPIALAQAPSHVWFRNGTLYVAARA